MTNDWVHGVGHSPVRQILLIYYQLQNVIDQTPENDVLVVRGDWNAKEARMLMKTGKVFVDPSAVMTQMGEDSDFCSLSPLTILRWRTLLVITKHTEDGPRIAQMDNTTI